MDYQSSGRRYVLPIREKAHGAEHPQVAATLERLASVYWMSGRRAEAEEIERRLAALRATKK